MPADSMRYCPTCQAAYPSGFTHCVIDGAALAGAERDPNLGAVVAERYHLVERLGHGGIGAVYRARHEAAGREVAVKLLHARRGSSASRERFLREARVTGRLSHPNIVEILDAGLADDGTPYLVMELLSGETLHRALRRGVPPVALGLSWVSQAANALSYAHRHGVIHRDVKPANLMLVSERHVKLVDFGLALATDEFKLTDTGALLGTPVYMSPEQLHGARSDGAFDVYALGVVLFEVLTGRLPRTGSLAELRARATVQPPEPPSRLASVSPELDALVVAMRAIDPAQRPSIRRVAEALRQQVAGAPEPGAPPRTLDGEELRWVRWLSLAGRLLDDAFGGTWPDELRQTYRTAEDALALLREGVAPRWDEQTVADADDDGARIPSEALADLLARVHARTASPTLDDVLLDLLSDAAALGRRELRARRSPDPMALSNPRRALRFAGEVLHRGLAVAPDLQRLLPAPSGVSGLDTPDP